MKRIFIITIILLFSFAVVPAELQAESAQIPVATVDPIELRLSKGLTNSEFYSYHLIDMAHSDPSNVIQLLEEALRFSPDLPAAYFHLAWVTFTKSPAKLLESMDYFFEGINAYSRNFWWSFNLTGVVTIGMILAFVFAMTVIVFVRLFVDMPLINHEIKEDNKIFFLFVLVFFISAMGPLYFIAAVMMVISFHFKKSDMIVSYVFFGALIFLPVFLKPVDIFLAAEMSPSLRAVVSVNEGKDNKYAIDILQGTENRQEMFSLALALKREGNVNEAIQIYNALLERYPNKATVYNNLGNCYAILGRLENAIAMYKKAVNIKPLVSTYYNLSQISRELLNFDEGDRYFDEARKVDSDAVARFRENTSRTPNIYYKDEVLSKADFWSLAITRSKGSFFRGTFVPLWLTPVVGLMVAITFFGLSRVRRNKAYSCKRCGSIICPRCERSLKWGDMCHDCFTSLVTLEKDPRDRIAKLMAVQEKKTSRKNILFLLTLLMPGSNLIYAGKVLKGAILTFLFAAPLMLFAVSLFYRISIYPYTHSWLIFIVINITVAFYILNIIATRRLLKKWV
ncbi:MAG: tetratricopeptide repeat protein [Thermodesulfovibrionales bacterium]